MVLLTGYLKEIILLFIFYSYLIFINISSVLISVHCVVDSVHTFVFACVLYRTSIIFIVPMNEEMCEYKQVSKTDT